MEFTSADLEQIKAHGLSEAEVRAEAAQLKEGARFLRIVRPAAVGDGIVALTPDQINTCLEAFMRPVFDVRVSKFVPASGAATRMFSFLLSIDKQYSEIRLEDIQKKADSDPAHREAATFLTHLKQFAFYELLAAAVKKNGGDIDALIQKGHYKQIVGCLLYEHGLNYAKSPKALIAFHRYGGEARTAMDEHIIEGAIYTEDSGKYSHIHFTVSPEFETEIRDYFARRKDEMREEFGLQVKYGLSIQKPSTDTPALDASGELLRDEAGRLVFRPGGHGALLENLNDLGGDIVFVKNIDNIACSRLAYETYRYKRMLGGYLVGLQARIFAYLNALEKEKPDEAKLAEMFSFLSEKLFVPWPRDIALKAHHERVAFLFERFNRPLRVCGVVRNTGEPGGGPFWVQLPNGNVSLQLVESSQVNPADKAQGDLFKAATHFNPVDIVCGLRDYRKKAFNLLEFSDPSAVFIAVKQQDGREIRVLERPGLWNGAMAYWNTVFIEVPSTTFSPVKTVNDLLRKEHQCG